MRLNDESIKMVNGILVVHLTTFLIANIIFALQALVETCNMFYTPMVYSSSKLRLVSTRFY